MIKILLRNEIFFRCLRSIFSFQNVFFSAVLIISFLLGSILFFFYNITVDLSTLSYISHGKPSIVLDCNGNEWTRFCIDKREIVSYESLPYYFIQAFVAAEDHDFFNHRGISFKGIVRSILINFYNGYYAQGASTITQQLVKLLFLSPHKTLVRKCKEQIAALFLECCFTKEQIIESYLNHVYFGSGIYGVEAASQRFWGKHAAELGLQEAALLAAIVRSPRDYNPLVYPLSAQKRRNIVLNSMFNLEFISQQQLDALKMVPLCIKESPECFAPYFREMIRIKMEDLVGKDALYRGGFIIQSTLDIEMQRCAQEAFIKELLRLRATTKEAGIDGALLCMDVQTGFIKAMVGGFNFKHSQLNRAFQAKRQMGSLFKIIIYAAAVRAGTNFAQKAIDEPLFFKEFDWQPRNASLKHEGAMTLAKALSRSNNIIAIKTLLDVGYENVIELAKRCGIKAHLDRYPSLALGCIDVSLKEATCMFNVFANHGKYIELSDIKWVKDQFGIKVWKYKQDSHKVLSPIVSGQVAKVLSISLERAKNRFLDGWIASDSFGKSGTSDNFKTSWFIGSTPSFTTGIYIGCDDNKSLGKNMYGSVTAFPIWLAFNKNIRQEKKTFTFDSGLKEVLIDSNTGQYTTEKNSKALRIFIEK